MFFCFFFGWYLYPWLVGFFTLNRHFLIHEHGIHQTEQQPGHHQLETSWMNHRPDSRIVLRGSTDLFFLQKTWWKKSGLHQLRLVGLSHYLRDSLHPNGGWEWDFWTIFMIYTLHPQQKIKATKKVVDGWCCHGLLFKLKLLTPPGKKKAEIVPSCCQSWR